MLLDRWYSAILEHEEIAEQIKIIASNTGLSCTDVRATCGLRLQRLFRRSDVLDIITLLSEVHNIGLDLKCLTNPYKEYLQAPNMVADINTLQLKKISDAQAAVINNKFHYIHSHRTESTTYALVDPYNQKIYASITFSKFDNPELHAVMPSSLLHDDIIVAARVYAFPFAPKNCISKLLSLATKAIHRETGCRVIISYLNTDLGFTGVTYQSANWQRIETFYRPRWAFDDREFVTERRVGMHQNIQFCDPQEPLMMYVYCPDKKDKRKLLPQFKTRVLPPYICLPNDHKNIITIDSVPFVQNHSQSQESFARSFLIDYGFSVFHTGNLLRRIGREARRNGIALENVTWDKSVRRDICSLTFAVTQRLSMNELAQQPDSKSDVCVQEGIDASWVGHALNEGDMFENLFGNIISYFCRKQDAVILGCTMSRMLGEHNVTPIFLDSDDNWENELLETKANRMSVKHWRAIVRQKPDGAPRPSRFAQVHNIKTSAC